MRLARTIAVHLAYLSVAALLTSIFVSRGRLFNNHDPARMQRVFYGEANRPFSHRLFIPLVVKAAIAWSSPEGRKEWSQGMFDSYPGLKKWARDCYVDENFFVELLFVVCLIFLGFYGSMWGFRFLFMKGFEERDWRMDIWPVVASIWLLMFFHVGTHYSYDIPTLLFSTWCLYFLWSSKIKWYYVAFAVGFVNKETIAIMAFLFFLWRYRLDEKKKLIFHGIAHLVILAGLRIIIELIADVRAPFGTINNYLRDFYHFNLHKMWSEGIPTYYVQQIAFLLVIILVFRKFSAKPAFIRRASLLVIPLAIGYIWGGMWAEMRVFYEVFPVFSLLAYINVIDLMGHKTSVSSDQDDVPDLIPISIRRNIVTIVAILIASIAIAVLIGGLTYR